MRLLLYKSFFILLLIGCNSKKGVNPHQKGDKVLASAFNKTLYASDLKEISDGVRNSEDSALIVNSYIKNWIKDNLLTHHAEKNVLIDVNIDKLVANYRASLIRHSYEEAFVKQKLDSTVTDKELTNYYNANKSDFLLHEPLIRCYFFKVKKDAPAQKDLERRLKRASSGKVDDATKKKLISYANKEAAEFIIDDDWYKLDDIEALLPNGETLKNLSKTEIQQFKSSTHHYWFLPLKYTNEDRIAPITHVYDKIKKIILHKRKQKLVQNLIEELYKKELANGNARIFL